MTTLDTLKQARDTLNLLLVRWPSEWAMDSELGGYADHAIGSLNAEIARLESEEEQYLALERTRAETELAVMLYG